MESYMTESGGTSHDCNPFSVFRSNRHEYQGPVYLQSAVVRIADKAAAWVEKG